MAKKEVDQRNRLVASNKKARHDYLISDTYEAGISLTGSEVKALRLGRASLADAWVEVNDGEAWLMGAHIPEYFEASWTNHSPRRKRKLLLHGAEILKLARGTDAKGMTIMPLSLYFKEGRAKLEIGLAQGKREWDKRQAIRERQDNLEARRAMRARTFR